MTDRGGCVAIIPKVIIGGLLWWLLMKGLGRLT